MANHHTNTDGHPAMDYVEHEHTFALFMNLVKYISVAIVVLLIGMAIFLL